ncbi:MAG: DNA-processing protein DprA [Treponema sp.]|jgi:DNA processing protein|nr:DNA-processing protein DprA [Treponema sp.]
MDNRGFLDLIISLLPGLLPKEKIVMINSFVHEEELYLETTAYIEEILNRKLDRCWDMLEYRNKADKIDTICRMRSMKWVSWSSKKYPPLLREIYDPPAVIYYRGELPDPEKSMLGMVGTRKPSPEAGTQAYNIAYGVGCKGISVVSGLALGIDSMSHRGNLASGVPGYAVLGSGIDEVYPASNRQLAKQILDFGGAILSEYPPGVPPSKWSFPARNRIISGLSRSVIIVEAPEKSGALITANFALDQGKDLWTASTGINGRNMLYDRRGTMKLAEDGAEIIFSEKDVFNKWNLSIEDTGYEVSAEKDARKDIVSSMADFLKIEV